MLRKKKKEKELKNKKYYFYVNLNLFQGRNERENFLFCLNILFLLITYFLCRKTEPAYTHLSLTSD